MNIDFFKVSTEDACQISALLDVCPNCNGQRGLLYDKTDEISAFQRGYAFNGSLNRPLSQMTVSDLIRSYPKYTSLLNQSLNSSMTNEEIEKT